MRSETCIGDDTTVYVSYDYEPGSPGKLSGPPEDCYPDEPEELSISSVELGGVDITKFIGEEDFATLHARVLEEIHYRQEQTKTDFAIDRMEDRNRD